MSYSSILAVMLGDPIVCIGKHILKEKNVVICYLLKLSVVIC